METLIVAEKPSVALRLALSLSEGKPIRRFVNGISYYELQNGNDKLYVVAAAGHLFTIAQESKSGTLPVFDVKWEPSYKVNKHAYFTKKYLDTIVQVGKACNAYINACDYDVEGTVIGSNIISYVIYGDPNKELQIEDTRITRMHFSTTTRSDLLAAYANREKFDKGNFEAGETRHVLDWLWGINLSRALMKALRRVGKYQTLSIGRVQGPTLAILVEREKAIRSFVPKDFWQAYIELKGTVFENKKGAIFSEEEAEHILANTKRAGTAKIERVEVKETRMRPFPPFDLTSLQVEASNVFGIDPSRTLAVAQALYEHAYISYPRTASQKLPRTLNLPRIINELTKQEKFRELAEQLIKENRFVPAEGTKEDEAHPAIYPTGEVPSKLSGDEEKIYTLIVHRFLASFADYATMSNVTVTANAGGEIYEAQGSTIASAGWLSFYPFYKPKQAQIQRFEQGEKVAIAKAFLKKDKTKPPARFNKASLIALLESKGLGTKATRAEIVDTLFKRGYVKNQKIEVTELGMSVYNALSKYAPEIIDENMTRKLEVDMDSVMHGKVNKEEVISEGKEVIIRAISDFKTHEQEIGIALLDGIKAGEKANILGKCPNCGGDLILMHSRSGKNFVRCSNWPKCPTSYPLPANATIVPTGKVCEICHTPIVKVFMRGKVFTMDLDPNCPSKQNWNKKPEAEQTPAKPISEITTTQQSANEINLGKAVAAKSMPTEKKEATAKKTRKKAQKRKHKTK